MGLQCRTTLLETPNDMSVCLFTQFNISWLALINRFYSFSLEVTVCVFTPKPKKKNLYILKREKKKNGNSCTTLFS